MLKILDETTLREIAKIGSGEFYRVSDNQALVNVFSLINQYEKAEIKETRYKNTTDFIASICIGPLSFSYSTYSQRVHLSAIF